MKIGILTLTLNENYGGLLQAYALQSTLERLDNQVVIFDRPHFYSIKKWRKPLTYGKRYLKKLLGYEVELNYEKRRNSEYSIVNKHALRFISEHLERKEITSFDTLNESDFDAFVVGSDQVWRPKYCWDGHIEYAYLDFAQKWNKKKIAYSASFGTSEWEYSTKQTAVCRRLIRQFDAVSVRENSGIHLCSEYLKRDDAIQTLDPTMLLSVEDYRRLYQAYYTPVSSGNLMLYFLDETNEKGELAKLVADEKSLSLFRTGYKSIDPKEPIENRIHPPIEEWLRGFDDAEFIVTDSFHGCVFSILFRKPFIVYGNKERGMARFDTLLDMFDLNDRLIYDLSNKKQIVDLIHNPIDYDRVHTILHEKKSESLDYLIRNLS